jgi:alcohol dehydrogenase, propanol-preferring
MSIRDTTKTVTIGHEGVGHIALMHETTLNKGFKVGDAVGFLYVRGCCFKCGGCQVHNLYCQTGKQRTQGFDVDGFFAEYAIVDYNNAVVLDESKWDMERASAVFCAGITAFNSVDSCNLKPGEWFGVVGCGGVGQLATQYAKAMGLKVVGIDISDTTLAEARRQGADAVFNSKTNPKWVKAVRKLTGGGCRAVAVYTDSDAAFVTAPSIIGLGGSLMVIGIPKKPLQVQSMDIVLGRYRLLGDSIGIPQRMRKAVEFTEKHGIMPVMDVRGGLDQLPRMVEEMQNGKIQTRTGVVFKSRI